MDRLHAHRLQGLGLDVLLRRVRRLLLAAIPAALLLPPPVPAAARADERATAAARLTLSARAERHVRERHFPGGRQTRGKSLFRAGEDLAALVRAAQAAPPRRQPNGRDKRVVDAGRAVGTDGRTGRPARTYVVVSEPDGAVVTAYPGR